MLLRSAPIKCVTMYLCTVCVHTTSQHTQCTSSGHHVPVYSVRTYHLATHSVYIKCVTRYLCTVCIHTTSQHTQCTSSVSPCTCVQCAYIPPRNTPSVHQVCHHVPVYSVRTYHLATHSVYIKCVTMYLCTACIHTTSQHTQCTSSVSPCTCVQRAYIPPHNTQCTSSVSPCTCVQHPQLKFTFYTTRILHNRNMFISIRRYHGINRKIGNPAVITAPGDHTILCTCDVCTACQAQNQFTATFT